MRGKFSSITVVRVPRKYRSKRRSSKAKLTCQSSLNSAPFSTVSARRPVLPLNTSKTIIEPQQKTIDQQDQHRQIASVRTNKEPQPINLSSSDLDKVSAHFPFSRRHRITPVNSHELFNEDFAIDFNDRYRRHKKKRIVSKELLCKLACCALLSVLIMGGLIGALIYVINRSKNSTANTETTTLSPAVTTTTVSSVCPTGGLVCPTPMLSWNQTGSCAASAPSYRYYSCCHQAISNQLTIEFKLIEEVGHWFIDDVSMTQGNGELLTNGGFESNFTGWTVTSSANLSITPLAYFSPTAAHSGSVYLYSAAFGTPDKIRQTINVLPGQLVNVSFWWYDEGGAAGPTEKCEGIVTLTP